MSLSVSFSCPVERRLGFGTSLDPSQIIQKPHCWLRRSVRLQSSHLNLSVSLFFATCPLSAVYLFPNLLCVSLLSSLKRNTFYTGARWIKSHSRPDSPAFTHKAWKAQLQQISLDECHRKSISFIDLLLGNYWYSYWLIDKFITLQFPSLLCFNPERLTASGWLWNRSTIYEPQPVNAFFLGPLPPLSSFTPLVLCNTFINFSRDDSPIHLFWSATSFVSSYLSSHCGHLFVCHLISHLHPLCQCLFSWTPSSPCHPSSFP